MGSYNVNFCELFGHVSWLWVSVAVALSMAVGWLWYGQLFSKAWITSNDIKMPENLTSFQKCIPFMGQIIGLIFLAIYIFLAVQVSTYLLIFGLVAFMGWQKVTLKYRISDMKKYIIAACIDVFYFAIVSAICIIFSMV